MQEYKIINKIVECNHPPKNKSDLWLRNKNGQRILYRYISGYWVNIGNVLTASLATSVSTGVVQPDGITIKINNNGIISSMLINDEEVLTTNTYSSSKIKELLDAFKLEVEEAFDEINEDIDTLEESIVTLNSSLTTQIDRIDNLSTSKANVNHNHVITDITDLNTMLSTLSDNISTINSNISGINTILANKQNTLTPGNNITIENNVINANINITQSTGTSTTAVMSQNAVTTELATKANTTDLNAKQNTLTQGEGIKLQNNTISLNSWRGTQAQYDALSSETKNSLYLAIIIDA